MRVKIGDTWHDSDEEPICIEVSETEQKQIADMDRSVARHGRYAKFPDADAMTSEQMFDWMSR